MAPWSFLPFGAGGRDHQPGRSYVLFGRQDCHPVGGKRAWIILFCPVRPLAPWDAVLVPFWVPEPLCLTSSSHPPCWPEALYLPCAACSGSGPAFHVLRSIPNRPDSQAGFIPTAAHAGSRSPGPGPAAKLLCSFSLPSLAANSSSYCKTGLADGPRSGCDSSGTV